MSKYLTEITLGGDIAVDDTLLVKDVPATAGSKIMEGFKPLFSAEAVERLLAAGYTLSGKTAVGEFGLDLVGEFGYPADAEPCAAARLVKEAQVKGALAVDVNGAPRRAAAVSGVTFIKPTYGTVSRYGVIATACSGEQVGVYAPNARTAATLLGVIAGHDDKDGTSLPDEGYDYDTELEVEGCKAAIIEELYNAAEDSVKAKIDAYADSLRAVGITVERVSFPLSAAAATAWQMLYSAETCNNLSRYDGVKFGYRTPNYNNIDELYVNTRTEGMNFLTKATVLYGSDVLSKDRYLKCYDHSLRVRRMVAEQFKALLGGFDLVVAPALSAETVNEYDIKDAFKRVSDELIFTAIPNLIGTPALVSGGLQLMGNHYDESLLLSVAAKVEGRAK